MANVKGTVAERLSDHIAGLRYSELSRDVIEKTKEALLDQLGCQLVGSTLGHCDIIYDFVKGFAGQPESMVVNRPLRTWAHDAAFVNATFGHACEIDDHMDTGGGHPGAYSTAVSLASNVVTCHGENSTRLNVSSGISVRTSRPAAS